MLTILFFNYSSSPDLVPIFQWAILNSSFEWLLNYFCAASSIDRYFTNMVVRSPDCFATLLSKKDLFCEVGACTNSLHFVILTSMTKDKATVSKSLWNRVSHDLWIPWITLDDLTLLYLCRVPEEYKISCWTLWIISIYNMM